MDKIKDIRLLELLKSHKRIIFLFGAGMSLALGNKARTWGGWLKEGRNYLSDSDISVFDAKFDEFSVKGLIQSARELFRLLKLNGNYDAFMYDTIESIYPVNKLLRQALVELSRCGDFLVTTNYDSLLEKSVGMESVTYDEPESILKILKDDVKHSVIHIHGIYADNGKTDNIIADDEQYSTILKNPGAQFIQQLMGTYPIIMLGCGNTVSDPNLHGFLSFAEKYLKSNIPYFYVHKDGEDISGIPGNCMPICYGEEYSDFPAFVEELSIIRIQNRLQINFAQFNPYSLEKQSSRPYGRLHFVNLFSSFVGRKSEMELLNNFLNESAEYLWWVVVGNGGIGKSRLVLEWIRQLPSDWYGIFIDPDKCDKIPDFQLFNNTIFVFDYIVGNEREIAYIIGELQRKHTGYKIRILFIERSLDNRMKNWLDHIKAALSSVDCIKFDQSSYSQPEIVPLMINSLKKAEGQEYTFDYLDKYLCECVEESIKNKYYFQRDKIAETISTSFCDDLPEKFWSPLYMSMYIELWVDHEGSPSIHTCEELLEKYIEKEEAQWRKILGDDSLVYGYAKALTLACVLDGYCISIPYGYKNAEIGKLDQYIRDMRQPGGKKKDWSRIFIHEYEKAELDSLPFMQRPDITFMGILDGKKFEETEFVYPEYSEYYVIEPEYPDMLREFIVCYYLKKNELEQFISVIRWIDIGRLKSISFLNHALKDFPNKVCFRKMLTARAENIHQHYVLMRTLMLIDHRAWFDSLDDIEERLLTSEYTAYVETDAEVSTWGMLAECLTFLEDRVRMLKFGMDFFDYLNARWATLAVLYMAPVIRSYVRGLILLNDVNSMEKYVTALDRFVELSNKYVRAQSILASVKIFGHYMLSKMYYYKQEFKQFDHEFHIICMLYNSSTHDNDNLYFYVDTLSMQLHLWTIKKDMSIQPSAAHKVTTELKAIYEDQKSEYIAAVLAQSYTLEYDLHKSKKAQKEMLMFFWKSVKQLLDRYPDNEKILISYIILLCDRILACNYNYSIFSEEDWNLFEKLSLQRPDLVELMVFYRMGLEYRIEHTNSKDKKWKDFQEKYFKFLLRMCETFQELEKDKNFTFPRTYPLEPSSNNVGNMFSSLLSIWKEDYTKTELELPHYDPDVKN